MSSSTAVALLYLFFASSHEKLTAYVPDRMPMGLLKKLKKLGFQNCEQKIFNSWAADDSVRDEATSGIMRLIRPSLASIVEDGGEETVNTMEDVTRIEAELKRDVEEKGCRVGFDFVWNWGQRA